MIVLSKPSGRHFRSTWQHRFAAAFSWIVCIVVVLLGIGASSAGSVDGSRVGLILWWIAVFPVVVAGVLVTTRRYTRAGIYADERGVTICNPWTRDRAVLWQQIDRFDLEPVRADPGVATVHLITGESIHSQGLSQARLSAALRSNPTAEAVKELNRLLAQSRRARAGTAHD